MLGAGGTCEFSAQTLRSDRRGAHVSPASARASDPAAPPSGIAPASDDAASPMRTGKTHRLKTCATRRAARGCPCPGAGVADKRSHGWRSEVSIERAQAWRAILFGTAVAGRVSPHLAWLSAAHVGAGWQPAQVSRGGSGLPTPSRWTFISALQASTHCMSAALRHPGSACSHSPLEGMGSPSLSSCLNCAASNPACR